MWRRPHVCEYYSRLHPETNINRAEQWAEQKKKQSSDQQLQRRPADSIKQLS